ncbi:MAG: ABC transporter permease [Ginsengibacter sp.]
MFKNYFKTAIRNLSKSKGFSAINIIGLACGLASCLLILLFVVNEFSYDHYNEKMDQIYRVDTDIKFGGTHIVTAQSPDPLGPALKSEYPQVKQFVRFINHGGILVKKDEQNIQEDRVILTDSTLFDVFTLPMLSGDPKTALVNPRSVVITESMAKKYFSGKDFNSVVGQTMTIDDTTLYKVTGIIKDVPKESHFHYDFFIPMYGLLSSNETNQWLGNNFNTYILLDKSADTAKLNAQLEDVVTKHVVPMLKTLGPDYSEFEKQGSYLCYNLMPLKRIHLYSQKTQELEANGNIQFVTIFSLIALFILIIACVNFMNLSTARSAGRAKEVGVRKVLGSMRKNLIFQFLSESLLVSFIAMVFAIIIAVLLLPYFNELSGKDLLLGDLLSPWLMAYLVILVAVVGILAGLYPSFYLSSFKPVEVLKGKVAGNFKTGWLRSGLVVFQFAISIFLIIGTIVIFRQLNFIQTKDVGFDRQQVLVVKNTFNLGQKTKTFRDEVLKLNGVKNGTITGFLPTAGWRSDSPIFPEKSSDLAKAISTQIWRVDANYIPTLDMKMIEGRNFSADFPTDSSGIIINQAFANLLNDKNPLNRPLYYLDDFPKLDLTTYHIIGVVKNFNFNSLHDDISPLVLLLKPQNGSVAFRVNTANIDKSLISIKQIYKKLAPELPFQYSFMDEDFNNSYKAEQKMGGLSMTFSILAILIACLGLFGLITYAAEQRTKEIGIRKVLGASVSDVWAMLSKDFLKLVLIAALIAFPVGWWAMNKWLQSFAYRIHISWWVFLIAGVTAILIALITVSFQAIKAAVANPVESLRSE